MNQDTTLINGQELFGSLYDPHTFEDSKDGFEVTWEWPKEIGHGFMSIFQLRPGLMLGIGDFQLIEDIAISFDRRNMYPPIAFGFSLSGGMKYTSNSKKGQKEFWGYRHGHSVMAYLPESESQCISKPPVGTRLNSIGLWIDPLLLNTLMEGQQSHIPTGIRDILNGDEEHNYYQAATVTAPVSLALQQILNCPYQSSLKRLYLEGKALELIAHSIAQFATPKAVLKRSFILQPQDIEKVHHAKKLVSRDFQNPPKLLDLARAVGLPHPKLNLCFREVYGTTVFGYLRETRLNRAKALLDDGRMNVTEVAYEVGYSSLSHFAKSFKDYHGIAPGNYLREVSSTW